MINEVLLYIGAFLPIVWGIAHLFPTKNVVKGFGNISADNKNIITMEWIIEGISLIFIGILIAAVTYIDYSNIISNTIYWLSIIMFNSLSVVSLFTGFKVNFLPFKLCPIIFTGSSLIILFGILL
ncbi:hypothetical protein ACFLS9_07260 [Bacteroidota bacterium]